MEGNEVKDKKALKIINIIVSIIFSIFILTFSLLSDIL